MRASSELRAGEWVQVRSKEEILGTLDQNGQLEGLPFMPEMFEACGQRFLVLKRAHKTCDPPNGLAGRRMLHTVHLSEIRCNGEAHGGCQARCLVFWKDAWLKKVDGNTQSEARVPSRSLVNGIRSEGGGCTEQDVVAGTRSQTQQANADEPIFVCQSTHLAQATQPLHWWDLRQYAEDYTSGNVRLSDLLTSFLSFSYMQLVSAGFGLGSALRWMYDATRKIRGGSLYPLRVGTIPRGATTPSVKLDLQPGELVKIRSYGEILATLNEINHNRGMYFDAEMVPYCETTCRVLARVSQIINEKTGKMQYMKNDCIMLEGVVCHACYATYRRFCPRRIFPYWREIWLERAGPNS